MLPFGLVAVAYVGIVIIVVTRDIHIDASGGLAAIDLSSGPRLGSLSSGVLFLAVLTFWLAFAARLVLSWRRALRGPAEGCR